MCGTTYSSLQSSNTLNYRRMISFLTVLLMYGTLSLTVLFYHLQWQVLNINCGHLT